MGGGVSKRPGGSPGESVQGFSGTLTPEDFDYFEPLGKGGFGRVVAVKYKPTGQELAMKIIPKSHILSSNLADVIRERNVCRMLDHPFIVKLYFTFQTTDHCVLGLSIVDGARMSDVLRETSGLTEEMVRFYIAETALALNYLHQNNIIYRDVKVDNVLLDKEGHLMLVDMGLVREMDMSTGLLSEDHINANRSASGSIGGAGQSPTNSTCSAAGDTLTQESKSGLSLAAESKSGLGSFRDRISSGLFSGGEGSGTSSSTSPRPVRTGSGVSSPSSTLRNLRKLMSAPGRPANVRTKQPELTPSGNIPFRSQLFGGQDTKGHGGAETAMSDGTFNKEVGQPTKRRMSVVGTPGYMAPEVLRLSVEREKCAFQSYGPPADYWALGALTYKLLMGRRPFPGASDKEKDDDRRKGRGKYSELRAMFSSTLELMDHWSEDLCNFILDLLDFDSDRRLGAGPGGFETFKSHPFFAGLDWEKLERKELTPPYIPRSKPAREKAHYDSYDDCVQGLCATYGRPGAAANKKDWWAAGLVKPAEQVLFSEWDVVVPPAAAAAVPPVPA